MWRVYKAAGRPFPVISDDDVIDFMVTEAIAAKVAMEDKEVMDKAKVDEWKRGHGDLRKKLNGS